MRRFALLLLVCLGCETVIDIDPPDYDTELMTVSYFNPDSAWAARITQTVPAEIGSKDTSLYYISTATVTVWNGDKMVDRLIHDGLGDGWYYSPRGLTPTPGHIYRLVVEADGLPTSEAESVTPQKPVITNERIRLVSESDYYGISKYLIDFTLEDEPGAHYYHFGIYLAGEVVRDDGDRDILLYEVAINKDSPTWHCTYEAANEPVLSDIFEDEVRCIQGIMTDRQFSGRSRQLSLTVEVYPVWDFEEPFIVVLVNSLSAEYFEYQVSLEGQSFYDSFSEPARLYSNFSGGEGIFAGYATTIRLLDLVGQE